MNKGMNSKREKMDLGPGGRPYHSLPPHYRVRKRLCEDQEEEAVKESQSTAVAPAEFRKRLRLLRQWAATSSEAQLTGMIAALLPHLGGVQLHYIASQLPSSCSHGGGLHHLCPPGCGDPFSLLPLHITFKILRMLQPEELARAGRVSTSWQHHASAPSLWQRLCGLQPWKLSREGCATQLERWSGGETEWKQVFMERWKLKRAWMAGQAHVRTFEGHTGGISCVQFDGQRIVSGSHDKTIKVWNVKTNSPWSVMTLAGHSGEVRCLHLEGNRLVSGSTDLTIKVWDLSSTSSWSSIACRVTMVGHTDTVRCVQMDQARELVISGSYDTTLKLWELKTGNCVRSLRGHQGPVLAIQVKARQTKS